MTGVRIPLALAAISIAGLVLALVSGGAMEQVGVALAAVPLLALLARAIPR